MSCNFHRNRLFNQMNAVFVGKQIITVRRLAYSFAFAFQCAFVRARMFSINTPHRVQTTAVPLPPARRESPTQKTNKQINVNNNRENTAKNKQIWKMSHLLCCAKCVTTVAFQTNYTTEERGHTSNQLIMCWLDERNAARDHLNWLIYAPRSIYLFAAVFLVRIFYKIL